MQNHIPLCLTFALVTILASCGSTRAAEVAANGDCEQVENGRPVGWGSYDSVEEWGSLPDGYKGKAVYFVPRPFTPIDSGPRKGEDYRSCAIVYASADGVTGADGLVPERPPNARYFRRAPAVSYKISFWVKSEASELFAFIQGWRTDEATPKDRDSKTLAAKIPRTAEWTYYESTVSLPPDTRKFAVMFQMYGYKNDGLELGRVCVDELSIQPGGLGMTVDDLRTIQIPPDPAVFADERPLEEILAAYRAGDKTTILQVQAVLAAADGMAAKSDEWYRQFYKSFEPRGEFTIACPIHPFKTRYYNDFEWSLNEPWKLVCKHCKEEGRKYYYYPNPDYPDDGYGCEPTDEVWKRDHDEAWGKAHPGIAWDHWDGQTHGDFGGGRCYHFLGKYYVNASFALIRQVPQLALAYHYAIKLFPPDSDQYKKADLYAHKAELILLCTARAHLGDDYLAAAEGISPQQFQKRMEAFFRPSEGGAWEYEKLTGFRYFTPNDITMDDPRWADVVEKNPYLAFDVFNSVWDGRAAKAAALVEGFTRLRAAFPENEDDLRRICERLLVAQPGDRERVAMGQDQPKYWLKRGLYEMQIHPYNLQAAGDNLAVTTQHPRLAAGRYLRDDEIMESVVLDVYYFWRNHFNQDGFGPEGSPTYTPYNITQIMDRVHGVKGDFDTSAPYYDKQVGAINMARMPVYKGCATKMLYYVTEDDYYIPWEDSVYDWGVLNTQQYIRMEKYGGGVPQRERKYLNIEKNENGEIAVTFNKSVPRPPIMLHDRRKTILRAGRVEEPTVVSLNYTKPCGHLHWPAQDLMIHACGQELACDLGYLGSDHYDRYWIKSFPAHNCVAMRAADGNPDITQEVRGDLRRHFVSTPFCQLVDAAEYDEADWKEFGNTENGEMSRQVLLMAPSQDNQYVVDISRVRGGVTHDYYFHCLGLGFDAAGINISPVADQHQNLYNYSGFSFRCEEHWGAKCVRELAAGKSTGPWQVTWSRIDDYRGQPSGQPKIHDNIFMRLWMDDEPGSEVITGSGPAQRYLRNNDYGRTMKLVCVRRPNSERLDKFVAVMEPYKDRPFVKSVRRLKLDTDDEFSVALAVETIHGTDYIISYGGPGQAPEVTLEDNGHVIRTDADVAVVSYPIQGRASVLMAGGNHLSADKFSLTSKGPAQWEGRLLDFSDEDDTLTIQSDSQWPVGEVLKGQPVIIQHRRDRSTYAIAGVSKAGNGRYVIQLDGQSHLMNNWLLVRQVQTDGVVVEPRPVLDKSPGFNVYAGEPGKMRMLGALDGITSMPIYNEYGTQMYAFSKLRTADCSGLAPGQEIGITRLEKGHDTVFVTNFAYATTD